MADDMTEIRLLVVDDHTLFRRGLVGLLQNEPQFAVVGEAASGKEALRLAQKLQFDIVLMDLKMPGEDGLDVMEHLLAANSVARIIVLTVSEEDDDVFRAIRAGARGYLLKNADTGDLLQTIRQVHAGHAVLSPFVTLRVLQAVGGTASHPSWHAPLTSREREVAELLAQGLDNHQISASLLISEHTAKSHVAHILFKLKLRSRRQLADLARPSTSLRIHSP